MATRTRRSGARHKFPAGRRRPALLKQLQHAVLWSSIVTGTIIVLATLNWIPHAPDEFSYDWRTAFLSTIQPAQRNDIALVIINEKSVARYASRSPIDRGMIVELIKAVDTAQPRAIGVDFIFDRPSDSRNDRALADSLKAAHSTIVLGATSQREGAIDTANLLWQDAFIKSSGRRAGTLFFGKQAEEFAMTDNVIRTMDEPPDAGARYNKTFDTLLAELRRPIAMPANLLIAWLLPPDYGSDTFTTIYIPEHEPVDGHGDGRTVLPLYLHAALKDKIVIIGADFIDRDQHLIPLSVRTKSTFPGAFIHAQIVAQLIDGRSIVSASKPIEYGLVFIISLIGFLISPPYFLSTNRMFAEIVFFAGIVFIGAYLFWKGQMVLPTSTMFLGWLLGAIGGGHYEKLMTLMATLARWPSARPRSK
jgi:adenylate cyclase